MASVWPQSWLCLERDAVPFMEPQLAQAGTRRSSGRHWSSHRPSARLEAAYTRFEATLPLHDLWIDQLIAMQQEADQQPIGESLH